MFALNVGDTSTNDVGLEGYYDNVVTTVNGMSTTFDFEEFATPTDKNQCKKGGWKTFSNPTFKNQGDCVSYVASDGKSRNNPGRGR